MRCCLLFVLVACGGAKKEPAEGKPAPSVVSCAAAADGMVGMIVAGMNPKPPDTDADALRKLVTDQCGKGQWSPEARRCMKDMKTADDANVCGTLLTDEQSAALLAAQGELYGSKPP